MRWFASLRKHTHTQNHMYEKQTEPPFFELFWGRNVRGSLFFGTSIYDCFFLKQQQQQRDNAVFCFTFFWAHQQTNTKTQKKTNNGNNNNK